MRQVPTYLLIGNGRVAKHFQYYFSQLQLPYDVWHRGQTLADLSQKLEQASHVLVLINDDAIDAFVAKTRDDSPAFARNDKIILHFSGSLTTDQAYGAHPLMTFGHTLYEPELYRQIPFVIDDDAPLFEALLPGLPNPHYRLPKKLKAKYHALCVMGGNFSCLLWNKLFNDFEKELKLPANIAQMYLQQQTKNLLQDHKQALTGPLIRSDYQTISNNIAALQNDAAQELYKSFVRYYEESK